ncbi:hypothetical protein ABW20_dc0102281 [Dactylellina cionopaga]|nr:hypothetical protein ABW20_dc0102281 [Dactylellina cionopaga]
MREIVARIVEKTFKRKRLGIVRISQDEIIEFTGPAAWTDVIFDYLNDETYFAVSPETRLSWANFTGMKIPMKIGDLVVLPVTSFSPGVKNFGAGEDDDPMAFVKHYFEGSWKPETDRHIGESDEDRIAREAQEAKEAKEGRRP